MKNIKKQKSLKMNAIMNSILTMSSFIFPVITFPYASRVLTPIGIGKVSFAISFISYFSMIAQLGIPTYGIRVCAQNRDNREELTQVVYELLFINMVTNVISYIGLFFAIYTIPRLQNDKLLYIIVACTIFLSSIGVEWLYKALEQYTYITVRSIIFKIVSLIALFLLVHTQNDYIIYGVITIFASSASNILNFLNIRKFIDLRKVANYNIKRHLKPVFVFFAMACATTIYTNLDTVMLGFMKTDADVGYYNAAVKIKNILVSIVTSLGAVLLPRTSYYVEHGKYGEFRKISSKTLQFVCFLAVPTMVYFGLFSKEGILLISGQSYQQAVLPMQILMPTVLFIGITNILGIQILVPLKKEKAVLLSEIVGAIVDVTLNLIFIPCYGVAGAAIGTLTAEFSVLIVQYTIVQRTIDNFSFCKGMSKYLFITIVSSGICFFIKLLELSVLLSLLASASIFGTCYCLGLLLCKDEIINEILVFLKIKRK
ncbi:MAG: flippase [Lachnospiraceae bacterium]|nr:flippase [Lachnospiraceae bacterium]